MKPVAWRYENKNVKGIRERDIAQDQVEVFREALMAIKYDFHTLVRAGALRLNGAGKIPVAEVDRLIEARAE